MNEAVMEMIVAEEKELLGAKPVYTALVVPINFQKLENSDNLSITKVDDYSVVGNTEQWKGKTRGVYIEPDTLVDTTRPEFDFLAKDARFNLQSTTPGPYYRVRAKNIRGCQSWGMLCPCPESYEIGQDCYEELGLGHYEKPPTNSNGGVMTGGEVASPPSKHGSLPVYHIGKVMKDGRKAFVEGESVVTTLKYHGSCGSWLYSDGEFHCRSHYEFKKEFESKPVFDKKHIIEKLGEEDGLKRLEELEAKFANWKPKQNMWWRILRENEELQKFVQDNPDTIVWGEVIGVQKGFNYGLKPGEVSYRAFDMSQHGRWLDFQEARDLGKDLKWVRTIHENFVFSMEKLIEFVQNMPVYDNVGFYEEGIVINTPKERWNSWTHRTKMKLINPKYLEKS